MSDVDDSSLLPGEFTQYVIYDHPADHPEYFVVRPWDIGKAGAIPRKAAGLFVTLDSARAYCEQFGMVRLERSPGDDPKIIEVWT